MSSSQHPIALRLEDLVGGETRLLATVMGLPLVDGIFPALVLAGALDSPAGVLQVGLLIFGGSATLAVVLAEMRVPPRKAARAVLLVGVGLVALAAVEAALAPTIESLLHLERFERFAALVIAAIAAKTASARIGEYLPGPGVIVGLGLLGSLDPGGARLVVHLDPVLIGSAAAAAGAGTAFALVVALLGPRLRGVVDVDRFRFGSAVALGLLPLSILGMNVGNAPLLVLAIAGLLAYAPDAADDHAATGPAVDGGAIATGPGPTATDGGERDSPLATTIQPADGDYGDSAALEPGDLGVEAATDDHEDDPFDGAGDGRITDEERVPWL